MITSLNEFADLYNLAKNLSFNEFENFCDEIQNSRETIKNNARLYVEDLSSHKGNSNKKNLFKSIIYKNYNFFRGVVWFSHLLRNLKNDKDFYLPIKKQVSSSLWKKRVFTPVSFYEEEETWNEKLSYFNNIDKLMQVFELLEDERSKNLMFSILKTRLTKDLSYINEFREKNPNSQYVFEKFEFNQNDTVFVDAGAFDGDTAELFFDSFPNFTKGILFEPNPISRDNLNKRFSIKEKDIKVFNKGLSNEKKSLEITINYGASTVEKGQYNTFIQNKEMVELIALDQVLNEKISFIKMDIEGSELDAINGCKFTIESQTPNLAICVYHRLSDLWDIPLKILEINPNYEIYLRHYSGYNDSLYETVLYAVRKKTVQF